MRVGSIGVNRRGMVPFIVVLGFAASLVSLGVGLFAFRAGDVHWQTLLFTEPPFLVTQFVVLTLFVALAIVAAIKFRDEPIRTA